MASTSTNTNINTDASHQPTEFELRRAALVGQIGDSLEQVLTQINALNRSLEGIIEIGNEFASVEALWSQFESVMGHTGDTDNASINNANNQDIGVGVGPENEQTGGGPEAGAGDGDGKNS